jgi:hypothetical protein
MANNDIKIANNDIEWINIITQNIKKYRQLYDLYPHHTISQTGGCFLISSNFPVEVSENIMKNIIGAKCEYLYCDCYPGNYRKKYRYGIFCLSTTPFSYERCNVDQPINIYNNISEINFVDTRKITDTLHKYDSNIIDCDIRYHHSVCFNLDNKYYLIFINYFLNPDGLCYNHKLVNLYYNITNFDYKFENGTVKSSHKPLDMKNQNTIKTIFDNAIKYDRIEEITELFHLIEIIPRFNTKMTDFYDKKIKLMQEKIDTFEAQIKSMQQKTLDETKENISVMDNFEIISETTTIPEKHKKITYSKLAPLMKQNKQVCIKLLEQNLIFSFDELDDVLKSDLEIIKICIHKKIIFDYKNLPPEIKSIKDVAMLCIENNILFGYDDLTDNLKTDEEIIFKMLNEITQ